jgi:3-deoxy-D-manno-octulosonic-acid transferase
VTVIVPRHPERGAGIAARLAALGFGVSVRSCEISMPTVGGGAKAGIVVADTLGELGSWFALAPVVFMGKSLSRDGGGHNPIEPVRLGACVVTGPSVFNFDIVFRELLKAGGACEVRDAASLAAEVRRLLDDDAARETMRGAATAVVDKLTGALPRTVDALMALLPLAEQKPARMEA